MGRNHSNRQRTTQNASEQVGEQVSIICRGGTWYINFQHAGRQVRKSLKTKNKKEARSRALAIERELITGNYEHNRRAPPIRSVIDEYLTFLRAEGRAKKTLSKYEHCFRLIMSLAETRRSVLISEIDLRFVDAFRQQRAQRGAHPKTVLNDTVLIRQLINFALSRRLLHRDPLAGLSIKKVPRTPQPWWTRKDVDRILATAESPYKACLTFLAETGARFGEMQHLTWEDVVLDGPRPHVMIQAKDAWKPKTGNIRTIPLNARAVNVLRGLPRTGKWVFAARQTTRNPEPNRQVSERRLLAYLKRILAQLGLRGHLHTFRHSFISHALVSGVAESIVRQWVGHVDREILQVYTHIADSASHDAMQRLHGGSSTSSAHDKETET